MENGLVCRWLWNAAQGLDSPPGQVKLCVCRFSVTLEVIANHGNQSFGNTVGGSTDCSCPPGRQTLPSQRLISDKQILALSGPRVGLDVLRVAATVFYADHARMFCETGHEAST